MEGFNSINGKLEQVPPQAMVPSGDVDNFIKKQEFVPFGIEITEDTDVPRGITLEGSTDTLISKQEESVPFGIEIVYDDEDIPDLDYLEQIKSKPELRSEVRDMIIQLIKYGKTYEKNIDDLRSASTNLETKKHAQEYLEMHEAYLLNAREFFVSENNQEAGEIGPRNPQESEVLRRITLRLGAIAEALEPSLE